MHFLLAQRLTRLHRLNGENVELQHLQAFNFSLPVVFGKVGVDTAVNGLGEDSSKKCPSQESVCVSNWKSVPNGKRQERHRLYIELSVSRSTIYNPYS